MRTYEVMIVLDPGIDEDNLRSEIDRATTLIRNRGGVLGRVDRWGRRRLAYEIEDHREGYYVVVDATAEPEVMDELDRTLHLADRVLRHKVIRLPDRVVGSAARRPLQPDAAADEPTDVAAPSPDGRTPDGADEGAPGAPIPEAERTT